MLREAYKRGAQAALIKEAGKWTEAVKALAESTTGKLRESLKTVSEAAKKRQLLSRAAKDLGRKGLQKSKMLSEVNKELLHAASPWLMAGSGLAGAGGLGYGGYEGAKALWPHAFED